MNLYRGNQGTAIRPGLACPSWKRRWSGTGPRASASINPAVSSVFPVHSTRGLDLSGTIHGAGGIGGSLMRSPSGTLATANVMRFSSKPILLSSSGGWGMYYYGYRFYDPATQRWLNRDPLEEIGSLPNGLRIRYTKCMPFELWLGPSIYVFARSNPIRYADTDGRLTIPLPCIGG